MLLRSSSTPVLGSLISTISECPNNSHHHQLDLHTTTPRQSTPCCSKLSCSSTNNGGSQTFSKSVLNSPSVAEIKPQGFRRVQSEGNLEELANASYTLEDQLAKKFARKPNFSSLEPIPSFSHHRLGSDFDESDGEEDDDEIEEGQNVDYSFTVENILAEEVRKNVNNYGSEIEGKMYLAAGLGMSGTDCAVGGGYGGGGSFRPVGFNRGDGGGGGGDHHGVSMEEHYKKMMEGNPGNPLFLRNYAQFLYQKKGDLSGAEEYYSRAILADPEDGEILSQYAKIIWELHHDSERATTYFERAVQVSSSDSHIHAAYASFLWDIEDEDEPEDSNSSLLGMPLVHGVLASASA